MTDEQYSATQVYILSIYQQLSLLQLDLDGYLGRVSVAHALGPMLDPAAYRNAMDNMLILADMAKALYPAYGVINELGEAALERMGTE